MTRRESTVFGIMAFVAWGKGERCLGNDAAYTDTTPPHPILGRGAGGLLLMGDKEGGRLEKEIGRRSQCVDRIAISYRRGAYKRIDREEQEWKKGHGSAMALPTLLKHN